MKLYAPNYYKDFACIADKCKHSCCIGWEIDVDADALAYYKTVPGAFGKRLRESISFESETPHFILDAHERCPFLNERGLCDMMTTLGEEALCQICTDHPRYRNFYETCAEIGLGLCCEAAAALILTQEAKTEFVLLSDDGTIEEENETENAFFAFRDRVLAILQDREKTMRMRIAELRDMLVIGAPEKPMAQWIQFYKGLEVLDVSWTKRLSEYTENSFDVSALMEEQLVCYFLCRHLADGMYDGRFKARTAFALHAARFICTLAENEADLLDVARMYSAEIEYSEENLEKILGELE